MPSVAAVVQNLASLIVLLAVVFSQPVSAQSIDSMLAEGFSYRNLGPYRVGTWVTDLAVPETPARDHLYTLYIATRNGGVWKSTTNGTTLSPIFDNQPLSSIGAVAVAPSNADVVWVGTGDVSCARSAYYGDGVYKSTDAGRSWKNMGLKDSHHIARILIHPKNPDIVYVAAMGHLFSTNEERGVFKTTDGGATWKRLLYIDDKTGAIDLTLDRSNPDTLYAAMYEVQRKPWRLFDGGPGSGLHKTTDGGNTWQKLGNGLPQGQIGRIGIDLYQRDPKILYAVIDNRNMRGADGAALPQRGGDMAFVFEEQHEEEENDNEFEMDRDRTHEPEQVAIGDAQPEPQGARGERGERRGRGRGQGRGRGRGQRGGRGGPAGPRPIGGEVYRSDDAGLTWRKVNSDNDDASAKAGYSFNVLRINTGNPDHVYITGSNLTVSTDGGRTWGSGEGGGGRGGGAAGQFRPFGRAFGDFRMLWMDQDDPNRIIAGSDGGVYLSYDAGRTSDHLLNLPLGEIYSLGVDMDVPYNIYAGLQDHESWKGPSNAPTGWVSFEHWISTGTGDGMYNQVDPTDSRWLYNNQEFGTLSRVDQVERTRTRIAPNEGPNGETLRWNWTSPIHLSPHNPSIVYTGSQYLHRSMNRGDDWQIIGPDLTTNNSDKISGRGAAIQHCTILTISESPVTPGVIWVGADDGNVQITRDGGVNWTNATAKIAAAGGPSEAWVSRVFASSHDAGTAFVSLSRHRQDDHKPYLFKTTDFGETWSAIAGNLPNRSINVVVQDRDNANLLVVGNDNGAFASIDGGQNWSRVGDMPPAPVHDLVIHALEGDLVLGTYGRGLWVTNISALKELSSEVLAKPAHLFAPLANIRPREGVFGNHRWLGDQMLVTRNAPNGVNVSYYLKAAAADGISVKIVNASGEELTTLNGAGSHGINTVNWRLDTDSRDETPAGKYTAKITVGESTLTRTFELTYPK